MIKTAYGQQVDFDIETYSGSLQYTIKDAKGIQFSTHYGPDGGGFGYLRFTLERPIGFDYHDIGFGYDIVLRKFLGTLLFKGQIRQIEESTSPESSEIAITALGFAVVAEDNEINRAYCDTSLSKWKVTDEIPSGIFRPDQFGNGNNTLGLFIHATTQETVGNARTDVVYEFNEGEEAKRLKCNLSASFGTGSLFDGQVDSVDDGTKEVVYKNDSGENNVKVGMLLFNVTQSKSVTVDVVNTTSNTFTVDGTISSWDPDDELAVFGPLFQAKIADITNDVITYSDEVGEGNVSSGHSLVNITQKSIAEIGSINTSSDAITMSDENEITGWREDDTIIVSAPLFQATISNISSDTITYSSPVGERIVSSTVGWILHNVTLDDHASVSSWNEGSNQVVATASGDISSWANGNAIRIYSAYSLAILDENNNAIWPTTDWREGGTPKLNYAVNEEIVLSSRKVVLRFRAYLGGSGNDTSFVQLSSLKVYSTASDTTADIVAGDAVDLLSTSEHGLDSNKDYIQSINKAIEPLVFEFETAKSAMSFVSQVGDENLNPIAWGIRLTEDNTLYLEQMPSESQVDYVVERQAPAEISLSADIANSYQYVRAIYTDKLGERKVTAWVQVSDIDKHKFNNRARRTTITIDNVDTEAEALVALQKALDDNKAPEISSSYSVQDGAIHNQYRVLVPFGEVKARGTYVLVEDFRSAHDETYTGTDIGKAWAKERVVAAEVDVDGKTVNIIPAGAKKTFERYMAELARIASL